MLLLIDGHSVVFRAWYAIPQRMSTSAGLNVNGVYGFTSTFLKVLREHKPTHAAVTFDTPAPTFRDKIFPDYKGHRPPVDPDLIAQIPVVKQLLKSFRVPVYECDGYEADDVVGTISQAVSEKDGNTLILTGDADHLQLVSTSVKVLMYSGFGDSRVYDIEAVKERYDGLGPEFVAQIKALEGDKSDNIPGVPGIGPKSARFLLGKFGGLDALLDNIGEVGSIKDLRGAKRVQERLHNHREEAKVWWKLTTIDQNVPVDFSMEDARFWRYERQDVVDALLNLEFRSIVPQIPDPNDPFRGSPATHGQLSLASSYPPPSDAPDKPARIEYEVVNDEKLLQNLVHTLKETGSFAFDTETNSTHAVSADLVGLSISIKAGFGWYIPVGHIEGVQLPKSVVMDVLRPVFEDDTISKAAHNANFDMTVLSRANIQVRGQVFDTMIAAALCGYQAIGLKQLALGILREEMTPITALIGTGRKQITMDKVSIEDAAAYAAADAEMVVRLREHFRQAIERHGQNRVFYEIELPLLPVLVNMELRGMMLDVSTLEGMSGELAKGIVEIEDAVTGILGGHKINLRSNRQLAEVLIDDLKAPRTRKTKTGWSMDASALERLMTMEGLDDRVYQIASGAFRHRELTKLKSTYVDSLPMMINPLTGRVHTTFNQVGSATGRLSSTDPNVQNIPVRTELGRRVRRAFKADAGNGWLLLSADYSQIELRILAHLSQEPGLLKAFREGEDIHRTTAVAMYGVEQVTAEQRRIAKILNFGVIYGLGPHGVARQTDLSQEQGKQFIELYFGKYPGIRKFIDDVKAKAASIGYAETVTGRRRYLRDIRAGGMVQAAAERVAVNMPIQGSAADVIKVAMVNIAEEMRSSRMKSHMVIQVHDELIFEVAPGEMEALCDTISRLMPSALDLSVPLVVDLKNGENWGDMS